MAPKISLNLYKLIDTIIICLPIIIILGSPFINAILTIGSFFFIYISIKYNFWSWTKEVWIRIAIIFWIYLNLIGINSLDLFSSFKASIFFFRFILFSLFIGYFAFNFFNYKKIFLIWFYIILFVCLDIWVQFIFGVDLFGYEAHAWRYSGLFGNELVAGAFLWKISGPLIGLFIFEIFIKKNFKYNFVTILFLLIPLTILITGERTSFIMFIFCIFISLFFFSFLLKKIKLFLISSVILASLLFSTINLSSDVKHRYSELLSILNNFNQSSYGVLFVSGFEVWKQNKFFGVGLKNFGKICDRDVISTDQIHQTCSNHPHNLYIQILSETGIVGLTIFLSLFLSFFLSILKKINHINKTSIKLYIFVSTFCYLIGFLWPIVTSGSFYSSWNGFFYWIVIGILINLTQKKSSIS